MFIKYYSSNDCKSMVCVQYDIHGALMYVKGKNCALHNLLHSEGCPTENGRIVKEGNMQIWAKIERNVHPLKSKDKNL